MLRGVTSDLQMRRISLIHKRLASVQRNAPLSSCEQCYYYLAPLSRLKNFISVIPLLLDDTRRIMESWGTSGIFDPFDNVYEASLANHLLLLSF